MTRSKEQLNSSSEFLCPITFFASASYYCWYDRLDVESRFGLMRYCIALLTVVTVILIGYALWQMQQRSALPDVHVAGGEVYDGGTIAAGAALIHTFRVENSHSFAVSLEAPTAGCTCTTATVSASSIPPGGAATVSLHVEPEDGKFSGSASIVTTHGGKSAETWLFATGKGFPTKAQAVDRSLAPSTLSGFR